MVEQIEDCNQICTNLNQFELKKTIADNEETNDGDFEDVDDAEDVDE